MPFETPKCDCGKSHVQITCSNCEENFCQTCDEKVHFTTKLKQHKRYPYIGQNLTSRFCEIKGHEEVTLNLFCKTCSKIICATCVVKEHRSHDSIPLKEAGENLKLELKGFMAPIQDKIIKLEEEIKIKKEHLDREQHALEDLKVLMGKSEMDLLTFVTMVTTFKKEHPMSPLHAMGLEVVADWIKKPLAGWKLLYCLSKDEKSNRAFHVKCDGKGPTVTVIRTKQGYVFGGYSHLAWIASPTHLYKDSRESFLFSLTDGKGRLPQQFLPYQSLHCCLVNHQEFGPCFGGGWDLVINLSSLGSSNSNLGATYQPPQGHSYGSDGAKSFLAGKAYNWEIEEVEIYLV